MSPGVIDFQTHPDRYRHWRLSIDGPVAYLDMDVDPAGGIAGGYDLKLNSYDLGVDIELADAVQRLRFEHPEVGAVLIGSLKERVFCAGANIGMLAGASHAEKVNFCKFTNETRAAMEEATAESGQRYVAAINGTAAGGGYELALATDHIMLIDDGNASVALPEVPLLGVLPGTGGLTRLIDKRHVRRDLADVFCTVEEGVKGQRAYEWRLVDELLPGAGFSERAAQRAAEIARESDRPSGEAGVELSPLRRQIREDGLDYGSVTVQLDRAAGRADITVHGPDEDPPGDPAEAVTAGAAWWPVRCARELDDAILHLRTNELEIGTWVIRTVGAMDRLLAHDGFGLANAGHWLVREALLLWRRVLKRLEMSSRSTIALIEPGSCFGGILAELALASDRVYMFDGPDEQGCEPKLTLTASSDGPLPMCNGLTRLATRFWQRPEPLEAARRQIGVPLTAGDAAAGELVTEVFDDLDWDDELRLILEERASYNPDALTAMEANLRFPGPETLETKIFGRLSAWQNWVFQRPNASGELGALRRYGTGLRPDYDPKRV